MRIYYPSWRTQNNFLSWSIDDLQYGVTFKYRAKWLSHVCMYIYIYTYIHTWIYSGLVAKSVIPWTVDCLAPLSMGFPRQENWSGFQYQEHLLDLGIKPCLLHFLLGRQILYYTYEYTHICIHICSYFPPCCAVLTCFSAVQLFDLWTVARQSLLSMGLPQARILEWVAMTSSRGIFPTPESNPDLWCPLHCRQVLYPLSHLGSPIFHYWLLKDTEYSFLCNIVNLQELVYLFYV